MQGWLGILLLRGKNKMAFLFRYPLYSQICHLGDNSYDSLFWVFGTQELARTIVNSQQLPLIVALATALTECPERLQWAMNTELIMHQQVHCGSNTRIWSPRVGWVAVLNRGLQLMRHQTRKQMHCTVFSLGKSRLTREESSIEPIRSTVLLALTSQCYDAPLKRIRIKLILDFRSLQQEGILTYSI